MLEIGLHPVDSKTVDVKHNVQHLITTPRLALELQPKTTSSVKC